MAEVEVHPVDGFEEQVAGVVVAGEEEPHALPVETYPASDQLVVQHLYRYASSILGPCRLQGGIHGRLDTRRQSIHDDHRILSDRCVYEHVRQAVACLHHAEPLLDVGLSEVPLDPKFRIVW